MSLPRLFKGIVFLALGMLPIRAHESGEWICRYSASEALAHAPGDPADNRKYVPNREVDILHLKLEVTPDWKNRSVSGVMSLRFKPIAADLEQLRLDGVNLRVLEATSAQRLRGFHSDQERLVFTFETPIRAGEESSVTVRYEATPREGLYFRTPEMGYPENETHLWTQGEAIEARHWYPCYDHPNEKFTSEIICHAPEGMRVFSNGRLVGQEKSSSGLTAFHWLQDKPHVNYLICLVAGYFQSLEDKYRDIPLAFHTLPSDFPQAPNSFKDTKDMMAFFEKEIGVPYPWAKYDQIVIRDFHFGGMENTTLTTLTDRTLFTDEFENIRSSQGLVAHELAHQWFGDLVTCKDWNHLWLNEGFATYYEHLYEEHQNGRDTMLYRLYHSAKTQVSRAAQDTRPIVYRQYAEPDDMMRSLGHLIYGKGAWVLHMLRSDLGPELYRKCVQTYLKERQFDNAVTHDLIEVIERLSGRSYERFFDQWVYHGGVPVVNVAYSWDDKTKLAKISVEQTQKLSPEVMLFHFTLPVRFIQKTGEIIDRACRVSGAKEEFYFPLNEAPWITRIDPELALLARINFKPPRAMLEAQVARTNDVLGQIFALEELASFKDVKAVALLKEQLQTNRFYGARIEASRALRTMHTPEALSALLECQAQSDARVRLQVTEDIQGFYDRKALEAAQATLQKEKNPDIAGRALNGLAAYAHPEQREILTRYLQSTSYRQSLAEAALEAMRKLRDPQYLPLVLDTLAKREKDFPTPVFASGLNTVGLLARDEKDKGAARQFLTEQLDDKRQAVQLAALRALGSLQDDQALPVLEKFAGASSASPLRAAAERAITQIREVRKEGVELSNLRNEVLELKKDNRDLKAQFEQLQKKFEAMQNIKTNSPAAPPAKPKKRRER